MRIKLVMLYKPSLAVADKSGREWAEDSAELHVFKSQAMMLKTKKKSASYQYRQQQHTTSNLAARGHARKIAVFLHADTRPLVVEVQLPRAGLEYSSGIGLNAYCRTWNGEHRACKSTAGATFLHFQTILDALGAEREKKTRRASTEARRGRLAHFSLQLLEHCSQLVSHDTGVHEFVCKGRIELYVSWIEQSSSAQVEASLLKRTRLSVSHKYSFLLELETDAGARSWRSSMLSLCAATVREVNDKFQASVPVHIMNCIRCPLYETDRLPLPGSAYSLYASGEWCLSGSSSVGLPVFHRLLCVAVQRCEKELPEGLHSLATLLQTDEGLFQHAAVFQRVVAHMLCAVSWALPYLPDFVNANRTYPFREELLDNTLNEHYKCTLTVEEGDCDGLAWLIYLFTSHALRTPLHSAQYPVASRVLELLQRFYIPFMVQGAVAAPSAAQHRAQSSNCTVDDNSATGSGSSSCHDQGRSLCCHTYTVLLPHSVVGAALQKVRQDIPGCTLYVDAAEQHYSSIYPRLPVILLEGTAACDPVMQQQQQEQSRERSSRTESTQHSMEKRRKESSNVYSTSLLATWIEEAWPPLTELPRLLQQEELLPAATQRNTDDIDGATAPQKQTFYLSAVTAYTSYLYTHCGTPSLDVCFVRCNSRAQVYTYGITAQELFQPGDELGLYMFNDLRREVKSGTCLLHVIEGVFQQLEPVPDVCIPTAAQCKRVQAQVSSLLCENWFAASAYMKSSAIDAATTPTTTTATTTITTDNSKTEIELHDSPGQWITLYLSKPVLLPPPSLNATMLPYVEYYCCLDQVTPALLDTLQKVASWSKVSRITACLVPLISTSLNQAVEQTFQHVRASVGSRVLCNAGTQDCTVASSEGTVPVLNYDLWCELPITILDIRIYF